MEKKIKTSVKSLDYYGRGIADLPKKTFVRNSLPGEDIELVITKEHKSFDEGITTKLLKKSPKRVPSLCPYFPKCGGCDLRHLLYPDTIDYKINNIKSILKDYINDDTLINIYKSKNYGRNKITLKVSNKKIGFYEKSSHNLIEINACLNVKDSINKVLPYLKSLNIIDGEVLIRSNYVNKLLIAIKTNNKVDITPLKSLTNVEGIILNDKTIYKNDYFNDKVDDYIFKVSYKSFFQVNSYINGKIFNILKSELDTEKNVLDLCSGVGTLSILASTFSKKVYAIEINKSNYLDSLENKRMNKVENVDFLLGDAFTLLNDIDDKIDTIIIDPPRSGISKKGLQSILDYNCEKVIYISCNPITLRRDLAHLTKRYKLDKLFILDMFMYTYHAETVVVLERRK